MKGKAIMQELVVLLYLTPNRNDMFSAPFVKATSYWNASLYTAKSVFNCTKNRYIDMEKKTHM